MSHPTTLDLGKIVGPSAFESWCTIQDPPVDPLVTESWDLFINALKGPQGVQGVPGADGLTQEQVDARVVAGITGKQNVLTFDNSPTENSANPAKSGGVFTALAGKMATMTVDASPTLNSANLVTSGGVYSAIAQTSDTGWVGLTMNATKVSMGQIFYRAKNGVLYITGSFEATATAGGLTTSRIPAEYMPLTQTGVRYFSSLAGPGTGLAWLAIDSTTGFINMVNVINYLANVVEGNLTVQIRSIAYSMPY